MQKKKTFVGRTVEEVQSKIAKWLVFNKPEDGWKNLKVVAKFKHPTKKMIAYYDQETTTG